GTRRGGFCRRAPSSGTTFGSRGSSTSTSWPPPWERASSSWRAPGRSRSGARSRRPRRPSAPSRWGYPGRAARALSSRIPPSSGGGLRPRLLAHLELDKLDIDHLLPGDEVGVGSRLDGLPGRGASRLVALALDDEEARVVGVEDNIAP